MIWELTKTYQSSAGRVAYDFFGEGKPLVLIHGTPFSSFIWRRIVSALSPHYKIYVYDLLGYGQSEKIDNPSLAVQNGVLAELFNYWGLDHPYVIAHDFGGATALRAHFLNNLSYGGLILADPVALRPWGSPFVAHVRQYEAAFNGLPDYAHEALLKAYIQGAAFHKLSDEAMKGHMAPWLGEEGKKAFYRQIAVMDQAYTVEVENDYPNLSCPVNILWGRDDEWIPIAQGEKLAEIFKAPFRPVDQCGHMMQEDAPEAICAESLHRFLL